MSQLKNKLINILEPGNGERNMKRYYSCQNLPTHGVSHDVSTIGNAKADLHKLQANSKDEHERVINEREQHLHSETKYAIRELEGYYQSTIQAMGRLKADIDTALDKLEKAKVNLKRN